MSKAELLQRAASYFSSGRYSEALRVARQALTLDAGDAGLHNLAGACAMQLGDPALAESSWLRAIELQPRQGQFYLNLAVLLAQQHREAEAERRFRQALLYDPASAPACYNLAYLLARRGQTAEAEQLYRRALVLAPAYTDAHYNLGVLLSAGGRDSAAEECYRRALAIDPRHVDAALNLGGVQARQGRRDEAELCFRQVLALDPGNASAEFNLGHLLAQGGRDDEAERHYRRSIASDPQATTARINLGALLAKRHQPEDAERCYREVLQIDPANVSAYYNLGVVQAQSGRDAEAEQSYRQALALDPAHVTARFNLGILLADRGESEEAERHYRQALALDPDLVPAVRNLATLLLQQGRYREGWVCYESRYDPRLPQRTIVPPELPFPQWRGESLAGKSLLVWPEQGFGDQIQMCRYLPLLKQQEGLASLTLVCEPALRPLLQTLPGVDAVIEEDLALRGQSHDYWTLLLSVPRWLRAAEDTIPDRIPYLAALPERRARWSSMLPAAGARVGLVWKGSAANPTDALRSLPDLEALAPLWSVPGIRFISLLKGAGEDQARQPPPGQPLLELGSQFTDFADLAAVVAELDLVICVDTAVMHVAGALGKACWVLRSLVNDWRWLRGRRDSPWYPGVVRVFQQDGGGWTPVIAAVRQDLQLWAQSPEIQSIPQSRLKSPIAPTS
ncbi:MAG: tetratricopeptide repeat protein [Nevskia sp.]|nr:tetratricopeptide repeat protein [Nevskia sp.]